MPIIGIATSCPVKGRAKGLNRRRGLRKAYGSLGMLSLLELGPAALIDASDPDGAANSDTSADGAAGDGSGSTGRSHETP